MNDAIARLNRKAQPSILRTIITDAIIPGSIAIAVVWAFCWLVTR